MNHSEEMLPDVSVRAHKCMCGVCICVYEFVCLQCRIVEHQKKIGNAQVISIEYVIISIALSLKIQTENQNGIKMENSFFKIVKINFMFHFSSINLFLKRLRLKFSELDKDYAKQIYHIGHTENHAIITETTPSHIITYRFPVL